MGSREPGLQSLVRHGAEQTTGSYNGRGTREYAASSKRQRTSQACEMCRIKKNKCNGERPTCSSCLSLDRRCCYSSDIRKRGLRSGYVRLLEMLWGLVFELIPQSDATVIRLLKDVSISTDDNGKSLLHGQYITNPRSLHRLWSKSLARVEIERLMSESEADPEPYRDFHNHVAPDNPSNSSTPRPPALASNGWHLSPPPTAPYDLTGEGEKNLYLSCLLPSEDVQNTQQATTRKLHRSPDERGTPSLSHDLCYGGSMTTQQLPSNGWHLLKIYFCYTHSWLPIVDKYKVFRTFHSYSTNSVALGEIAVLWAILAYALVQDSHARVNLEDGQASEAVWSLPFQYYRNAERLIMTPTATLTKDHVEALLILAMIDMGFGNLHKAWLSVGHAIRIIKSISEPVSSSAAALNNHKSIRDEHARTWLGCFVVETLISSRLGRKPQLASRNVTCPFKITEEGLEEWDIWNGLSGFNTSLASQGLPSTCPSRALSIFNQYVDLICILNVILQDPPESSGDSTVFDQRSLALATWEVRLPPHCKHSALLSDSTDAPIGLTPHLINLHLCHSSTVTLLNSKHASIKQHYSLLQPPSSTTVLPQCLIRLFCDNFGLSAVPAAFESQSSFSRQNSAPEGGAQDTSNQAGKAYYDDLASLWPAFQNLSKISHSNAAKPSGNPNHPTWEATGSIAESYNAANNKNHGSWHPTMDQMDQAQTALETSTRQALSQLDDPLLDESLLMQDFPEFEASFGGTLPPPGSSTSIDHFLQPFWATGEVVDAQDVGSFLDDPCAISGSER
jgi:hypothetical protein